MRIAVVGGGFTGCMAALHASSRGAKVSLFEAADHLGGVLRELKFGERIFFNNCQYLRPDVVEDEPWLSGLEMFPHEYGSLTALGNAEPRIVDDCAQPALDGLAQLDPHARIGTSALERLRAYGEHAEELISWASGFGDLERLDYRCTVPMQLSRVFFPDDEFLAEKKAGSPLADEVLAIPRRLRSPQRQAEPALLPRHGFNALFEVIAARLRAQHVEVFTSTKVRLDPTGRPCALRFGDESEEFDWIVWSANPTAVLKRVCGVSLKTPPVPMKLMVGRFSSIDESSLPVSLPYYWQIFDKKSPIVRLYIYKLDGEIRFSAESFVHLQGESHQAALWRTLQLLGLGGEAELAGEVEQLRYINYSPAEAQAMHSASSKLLEAGIIPGGWCDYGRSEKVLAIKRFLDEAMV